MIPTSYLFKDLYADRWGDPANPHAVDVPPADGAHHGGRSFIARVAGLFRRRRDGRPNAWSFTIPTPADHKRT